MNIQGNHDEAWLERHLASHNGPRAIRTCAHHLSPLSRERVVKKKEKRKKKMDAIPILLRFVIIFIPFLDENYRRISIRIFRIENLIPSPRIFLPCYFSNLEKREINRWVSGDGKVVREYPHGIFGT